VGGTGSWVRLAAAVAGNGYVFCDRNARRYRVVHVLHLVCDESRLGVRVVACRAYCVTLDYHLGWPVESDVYDVALQTSIGHRNWPRGDCIAELPQIQGRKARGPVTKTRSLRKETAIS